MTNSQFAAQDNLVAKHKELAVMKSRAMATTAGPEAAGPDELLETLPVESAQSSSPVSDFMEIQLKRFNTVIAPYDAALSTANKYLRAALMYDFGISRLNALGAADIERQTASEYFASAANLTEAETYEFNLRVAAACAEFEQEHGALPSNLSQVQAAIAKSGLPLPTSLRGIAYDFDAETQTLFVEPRGVSIPFIAWWLLLSGVAFTLRMKLISIRGLFHAFALILGKYRDSSKPGEISHVRAFTASMSSAIGLGAISAVVVAVGAAGPGAAFWIMVCALLSMSLKFTECSLAVINRRLNADGTVIGGPMRTMNYGFRPKRLFGVSMATQGKLLGTCFATICAFVALFTGNAMQVSQSLAGLQTARGLEILQTQPWIYGAAMMLLVSLVVFRSVRWLGRVTQFLMPLALVAYVLACCCVIGINWSSALPAFQAIFTEAFNVQSAVVGGLIGVVVTGITQATFSTDAGLGTSAILHAPTRTDEPTREGVIAMSETFFIGVVLSLLTALTIGASEASTSEAARTMLSNKQGIAVLMNVFASETTEWFAMLMHVVFFVFAVSACIAWCYIGERCMTYLFGPSYSLIYKVLFVICTFLGSVAAASNLMELSQLLLLTLAIPNVISLFWLHGIVAEELDDYWARLRAGKFDRTRVKANVAES